VGWIARLTSCLDHSSSTHCRNGPRGDRPSMLPAAQSETLIRNGFQSRQQSPQPSVPHAPASYPPPGSSSTSFSQGGMMVQTPQPRLPPLNSNSSSTDHHYQQASSDAEWASAQRAPQQLLPSSRPNSATFIRPGTGDLSPSTATYTPNGHAPLTPVQLRQRT
jgi:hypothetical protein